MDRWHGRARTGEPDDARRRIVVLVAGRWDAMTGAHGKKIPGPNRS